MARKTVKTAVKPKADKGHISGNTEKVLLIGGSIAGLVGLFLLARSQGGSQTDQSNGPAYLLGGGGQGAPYYQDIITSGGTQAPSQGATGTPSAPTTQPGATGPLGAATVTATTPPAPNTASGVAALLRSPMQALLVMQQQAQAVAGGTFRPGVGIGSSNASQQAAAAAAQQAAAQRHPVIGSGLHVGGHDPAQATALPVSNPVQQIQGLLGMGAVTGISAPTVTGTKVAIKQGLANVGQGVKAGAASGLRQAAPRKI